MKKYIANIITGSRIAFSLSLLYIPVSSPWFYTIYLFCGLTDMVDGTIARMMESVSEFGAKLDTVADFVFMFICSIKILPLLHIPVWLCAWIIMIALIKIFNTVMFFIQKKKIIAIHSVLNKITGFALFFLPLLLTYVETVYSVAIICVLATIAAIQEVCFITKRQDVLS